MPRYVPKTYNNRRGLRIFIGAVTTIALSVVILFLILFFIFQGYVVDGQLDIPWLIDDTPTAAPPVDGDEGAPSDGLPDGDDDASFDGLPSGDDAPFDGLPSGDDAPFDELPDGDDAPPNDFSSDEVQ